MKPQSAWQEIESLYHQALDLPVPQRQALLAAASPPVRMEVESLLDTEAGAACFTALPIHLAADLLDRQPGALRAGQCVGSYEIESLLSAGGMGEVYLAHDSAGVRVALKILRRHLRANAQAVDRFETEARAASALDHPNTVTVYECGDSASGLFIAMEWLDGCTFRQVMNAGPVAIAQAIEWGGQVARALSAAHAAGILHRDIKPENIILCHDGVVKILDFGLARLAGPLRQEPEATGASGTISGTLSGTLLYMSPEIFRGEAATSASDMFSLGGLLYELMAGRHPFAAETNLEVYDAIECRAVAAPSSLRPGVSPEIDALIQRMLDREPARRPSANEACAELSRLSKALVRT